MGIDEGLVPKDVVGLIAGIPRQRLPEPLMFGGGVVGDYVHHDAHAVGGRLSNERVHLRQGAEGGVDGAVIRHVVAVVPPGGAIDGGEPEQVHPERRQVVQVLADAVDVPHAIAVAVLKTHGVDLVDNALLESENGVRMHQRGRWRSGPAMLRRGRRGRQGGEGLEKGSIIG
ncbi:hypothetical protein D3C84_792300 [compost metagenome]